MADRPITVQLTEDEAAWLEELSLVLVRVAKGELSTTDADRTISVAIAAAIGLREHRQAKQNPWNGKPYENAWDEWVRRNKE